MMTGGRLAALLAWLRQVWSGDRPADHIVAPPPARAVREFEYQQQLDAESAVLRSSARCRAMARKRVAGVIERVKEKV